MNVADGDEYVRKNVGCAFVFEPSFPKLLRIRMSYLVNYERYRKSTDKKQFIEDMFCKAVE